MRASTAKTASRVDLFASALVVVVCALCSVEARQWRKVNVTCPKLERCHCTTVNQGALTLCRDVSDASELDADMATLEGVIHRKLTFDQVQITELPARWFTNHTVIMLIVNNCPLRDIGEAALNGIDSLSRVMLENDQLESVPRGLTAAKHLHWLEVRKNRISFLQGVLFLPELYELDLRYNAIEVIDDAYLSGMPNLQILRLSSNRIQHLSPDLFKNTGKLKIVEFRNNRITAINNAFNSMRYLETLDLSDNMITDADGVFSSRMPYLKILKLDHNRIQVVTELASYNAMIKEVYLNDNEISQVDFGAFAAIEAMTRLYLNNNNISRLHGSVFHVESKLEILSLADNALTSVAGTFSRTRRMSDLRLFSNRIEDISDAFKGLTLLRKLSLMDNLVTHVPDGTFSDNSGLLEINLSNNRIWWVGKYAFKGIVTLEKVLLQNNRLLALNGSFKNLPKLRYVDASYNSIQSLEKGEFTNNGRLTSIHLAANNISTVQWAFTGASNLTVLVLRKNRVELLRRSDFARVLRVRPAFTIDDNPLLCDCRLAWLVRPDAEVQMRNYAACEGPPWLKGKLLADLTQNDLTKWQQDCQPGCQCDCVEDGIGDRAIHVDCSSAALNRAPKVYPEGTTQLELRNNRLEELDDALVNGAPHLQILSLKNNLLSSLNATNVPEKLRSLDISENRLKRFPHALVSQRELRTLRLSGNPFTCECSDYPFRQWIEAHGNAVLDIEEVICAESSNSMVSLKPFVNLGQKQLCPAAVPRAVAVLLPVLVALAMGLAISAAYLRYRRELKVWLYARGLCLSLQCVKEDELDEAKLFDVFLSFSSRDGDWVHAQLLPGVESLGFSVCTYERNFKGGFLLQDIIRDAVACSRRTLLLLTRNFLESEWCRWEFRLAYQRALEDHINRLVVVLVDDVALDVLDEDLREFVRAVNYIRWGEPNFWDKLLYSLPKKDSKRKLITDRTQQYPMEHTSAAG
ncbi:hypothetical protein V5799_020647 [Amblyomma americanum]|uniref:Uncharacterized protein n=1 Tax=Amblyomma americanum TaxID=6943 RepID=A0AAQ4ETI7_AMBAM